MTQKSYTIIIIIGRLARPLILRTVIIVICVPFEIIFSIKAFVHVSTAFSNPDKHEVEEKVYDPPMDPEKLIALTK